MFDTVWKIQVDADRWTERDRQKFKIIHEDRKRERCTEKTYRVKKEDYLRWQKERQKGEEKLLRNKERRKLY